MQSLSDAILDLVWLFQCSCADCGVSSAQGYFFDVARLGHWIHSGGHKLLIESERVVDASRRRRQLFDRLEQLDSDTIKTLALAYTSPVKLPSVDGVAIALLAEVPSGKNALSRMLEDPKPKKVGTSRPDHSGLRFRRAPADGGLTTAALIFRIYERSANDAKCRKIWKDIIGEGLVAQSVAVAAFRATWKPRVRVKSAFRKDVDSMGLPAALAKSRREEVL